MNKRVCFVSQRQFPGDARLENEVRALQEDGYDVHILCTRGRKQPRFSTREGVHIFRVPSLTRQRAGKLRYVVEYASFWLPTFLLLTAMQVVKGFRLVHVTNLPDALLFVAIVPKLLGARIIFDVRECSPEMFIDRFGAKPEGKLVRLMTMIEQACLRFADATVTCTDQMRQALIRRGGDPDKIAVVLNVGSSELQTLSPVLPDPVKQPDTFRLITHGTIIKRYGHEVLIRAMPQVIEKYPHIQLDIIGRGQAEAELKQLVESLGLQNHVTFYGFVPDDELVARLRAANCGVIPILRNTESDLVHTHKMFEYIHIGLPVIISRTSAVEAYFDANSLYFIESGNSAALAQAIVDLASNPQKRHDLARNALAMYDSYAPVKQRLTYSRLVNQLLEQPIRARLKAAQHENIQP